jgi:hypothetical protein
MKQILNAALSRGTLLIFLYQLERHSECSIPILELGKEAGNL